MSAMLTTIDNPYNPFDQFDEWYNYDVRHGYNSCSYLARLARTSPELTDELNEMFIEDAIDRIVEINAIGLWKKVYDGENKNVS